MGVKIKKFVFDYYKSIIILILIFLASTIPANEVEKVSWLSIPNLDKLIHYGMYFLLTCVLIYDMLRAKPETSIKTIFLYSVIISILYGGSMEILQMVLISSRSEEILDFLFNSLGAVSAIILWGILGKIK